MHQDQQPTRVVVTDIDISFGQMFALIIKFTVACVPAAIVLGALTGAIVLALGVLGVVAR